jgi:predicted MPP superfamily phosphohydrolase
MLPLLHLSDLHITTADADTQFDRDALIRDALINDLGKEGRTNFAAILVTGDLAYHGRTDEFARVKTWLEELRAAAGSAPEAVFVVPGNHDVNQATVSKDSSLWELHQSLRNMPDAEQRLASLNKKLHDPFDFLTALSEYRAFATEHGCPTNPKELAWTQVIDQSLDDGTSVRFHGLNSALISDAEDKKANLLLGVTQFHEFDDHPGYVNIVLCHHPQAWLMDGNDANDYFRNRSQIVLCGHDHDTRCYKEGKSLRIFAGAVHPNPRESRYEPCYHVIRLAINTDEKRVLRVQVETRVWMDKDKSFGPHIQRDGSLYLEEYIELKEWSKPQPAQDLGSSPRTTLPLPAPKTALSIENTDVFAAARRKLIVHFFRLGTLSRYKAVIDAGVWDETDDAFDGQARWGRVFERAEKTGKFDALWDAVAATDKVLAENPNPFSKK